MIPKLRQCYSRSVFLLAVSLLAALNGFSQLDGSVVSDLRERLSKTGVFFRVDAPRSLRNSGDEYLPLFVEVINGVEQEAHTTGSSVSNRIKRSPLSLLGVDVSVKPSGASRQFTAQHLLLGPTADYSYDARVGGKPLVIADRFKTTLEIPRAAIQSFLGAHFLGGPFGSVDFWITIKAADWPDQSFYLRVQMNAQPLPQIPNWYRGDVHYHSGYTDNPAERGYPLDVTRQAAIHAGLDWLILTDHSTDLSPASYQAELEDVKKLRDARFMLIRGEEITTASGKGGMLTTVHMVAAPSPDDPDKGFPEPGKPETAVIVTGDGSLSSATIPVKIALARINGAGGFAFAAHPFDPISPVMRGGRWDLLADMLAPDGKQLHAGLAGIEPWNRATLSTGNDMRDPFCIQPHQNATDCFQPDAAANQYARLESAIKEAWQPLLQRGLAPRNGRPDTPLFKTFLVAGSDAHGDLNFEATMDVTDFLGNASRSLNGYAEDNALGRLSTIVFAPGGMGARGENVLRALRDGHSVGSNGPILIAGFDRDSNGSLADAGDVTFGQELVAPLKSIPPLQLQWVTDDEFGPVQSIELIVGTLTGELAPLDVPISPDKVLASGGLVPVALGPLLKQGSPDWKYIRLVAMTRNSANAEFRCYTNPIWIKAIGD